MSVPFRDEQTEGEGSRGRTKERPREIRRKEKTTSKEGLKKRRNEVKKEGETKYKFRRMVL